MEIREENIVINIDTMNFWEVLDLGHLYCKLFNEMSETTNSYIRSEIIEKCLTYLITCVQKLGKYSGVIYSEFHGEKMELEIRVNQVIIRIVSLYAKDFKNCNLFLGVLLDGISSIEDSDERLRFINKIITESYAIYDQFKMYMLVKQPYRPLERIAQ